MVNTDVVGRCCGRHNPRVQRTPISRARCGAADSQIR